MRFSATKALLAAIALVLCALPSSANAQIAFAPSPQYPSLQCASLADLRTPREDAEQIAALLGSFRVRRAG